MNKNPEHQLSCLESDVETCVAEPCKGSATPSEMAVSSGKISGKKMSGKQRKKKKKQQQKQQTELTLAKLAADRDDGKGNEIVTVPAGDSADGNVNEIVTVPAGAAGDSADGNDNEIVTVPAVDIAEDNGNESVTVIDWSEAIPDEVADDRPALTMQVASSTAQHADRTAAVDTSRVPDNPPYSAFVGGLSSYSDEESVAAFFSNLGILKVHLPRDNGVIRGFGFVEFATKRDLIEALELDGEKFMGKKLRINVAQERDHSRRKAAVDLSRVPAKPPYSAFVGRLPFGTDEKRLASFFSKLNVLKVHLPNDYGVIRGFGFVEFATKRDLIEALKLDGDEFLGNNLRIKVAEGRVNRPADTDSDFRRSNLRNRHEGARERLARQQQWF